MTHAAVAAPGARFAKLFRRKQDQGSEPRLSPLWTFVAWLATLAFLAPVAWMVLTSVHQEADAATKTPTPVAAGGGPLI